MDSPRKARTERPRRAGWLALGKSAQLLVGLSLLGLLGLKFEVRQLLLGSPDAAAPLPPSSAAPETAPPAEPPDDEPERELSLPSGAPTRISCADAQRVTAYLERELAAPPIAPTAAELAQAWAGMLDPHGLWSAAPDSPVQSELLGAAPAMLQSFSEQLPNCEGAQRVAHVWGLWEAKLLGIYDAAYEVARARPARTDAEVFRSAAEPIFEDDPVTHPATELARELGERLGTFGARFPDASALVSQARSRYLPDGVDTLSEILILAALRAYVPLIDPHGDFAPNDEEWALFAGDDTLDAGSPLWGEVTRTPLGARVIADPTPPLQLDDLVLSINGLTLAGASIDQIEQAARSPAVQGARELRVLRQGEQQLLSLRIEDQAAEPTSGLETERLRYGRDGQAVLRIAIADVGDDLGKQLADVLRKETPGTSAVLLDLRGNGGGSLDAAVESLSLFLPGARLFPLIHRGSVTEVLQAESAAAPYLGPLAVLVDGDTASAAEMLAGAIQAYDRGSLIGAHTFGKGCVQEYFDNVVDSGVLRMTTLQFVMPNGQPLQQIGLSPDLVLPLPPASERESQITRQPITFSGPDVRDHQHPPGPAWPRAAGAVGPCQDAVVCSALARLSGVKPGGAGGGGRGPNANETSGRAGRPRAGTR